MSEKVKLAYTAAEVAERLQISIETVRRRSQYGLIPLIDRTAAMRERNSMDKELKSVINLRPTKIRCCGSCASIRYEDGSATCIRPNGPTFDTGDGQFWFMVCDRWVSAREQDE